MGLRYSQVLGKVFYNIKLSDELCDMIDTHFTGAAHHLRRFEQSESEEHRLFHLTRHRIHLRLMMTLVHKYGDFTEATDPSNRDLDRRDTWSPNFTILPDPNIFRSMKEDWRCGIGQPHLADLYIHDEEWLNYFMKKPSTADKM